nr:ATP-binding protein [Pseudomonas savastanoi]
MFSDPTIADAILDRIVHKYHVIELKGESIQRVKSRKRA